MKNIDERNASADDLWAYCLEEYNNPNLIVKILLDRFYAKIGTILKNLQPSDRVLEVGCGAAASSLRISKMLNGQYFEASEYDQRYVQKIKEQNYPFIVSQESVYSMRRADGEFDCVIFLEVLEHIDNVDLALQELFRVAKKNVIISVPNEPIWSILNMVRGKYLKERGNTPGHINRWSPGELKRLIERYGTVQEVYTPLPWIIVQAHVRDKGRSNG